MKHFFTIAVVVTCFPLFSQQNKSFSFRIPPGGISTPASDDWNPTLLITEPDPASGDRKQIIKDSLVALYGNRNNHHSSATQRNAATNPPAPVTGTNFAANGFNSSTPCDNEIAVANNGQLISVQNSTIYKYNTATSTYEGLQTLGGFALPLGNTGTKYDPKVIYDPEADRFILVCLGGYTSSQTNIIVGFSRSDSANGTWNLYKFPGNPLNDTLWSDYPMLTINDNELFITVNLLHDNQSWQLGFVQSICWQINKWDGYYGDTLRSQLHTGINYNGNPVRDLCPVEGGGGVAQGPGAYFISDRNLSPANDSFFIVHISDTANAVGQQVTVTPVVSNNAYFMPPNAREPGSAAYNLATNDARVLGAFMQNGIIQFVNNTMDTASGRCSVYHGMISNVTTTPSLVANIISDTSLYYGYPNIAYAGYDATDNSAMIFFLHSDSVTFPGHSVIFSDGLGNYSSRTDVKSGLGYINVLGGNERWGDYSGIQRRYDQQGTFWVNGMYGLANHTLATWVTQIGRSADLGTNTVTAHPDAALIFPNPFADNISVQFTQEKAQIIRFALYDVNGKLVQVLLNDFVPEGPARFGFSPKLLPAGVYLLRAEAQDGSVLFVKRVVRE